MGLLSLQNFIYCNFCTARMFSGRSVAHHLSSLFPEISEEDWLARIGATQVLRLFCRNLDQTLPNQNLLPPKYHDFCQIRHFLRFIELNYIQAVEVPV